MTKNERINLLVKRYGEDPEELKGYSSGELKELLEDYDWPVPNEGE